MILGALGLAGGAFEKLKFAINPTQVPSLSTSQRVEWLENRILELENILTDVLNPSALQIMRYVLSRSESNFGNDRADKKIETIVPIPYLHSGEKF
ncbi:hypothetical protein RIR_jg8422.t1 [Rhizophagus irregularis DAOM 181602=DAOM 197198]|nr:hypothetical protein RIR_jg8422.t1 [Rhizophagus irregularis DAOM 181602=DAOM 197198]